jgi:hypothetical protein
MEQGTLIDVSEPTALHAAQLAIAHKLRWPMR